jgi:HK97 family phage major capsid protein
MNLLELKQERAKLLTEERSLLESIQGKPEVEASVAERFKELEGHISLKDSQIRATERQEAEARSQADAQREKEIVERAKTDEKGITDLANKSFHGFIRGVKPSDLSPEERALYNEAVKRGQVVGTDSAGGYLTPDYFSNEVIKTMKFYGGMLEAAKILNTNDGNPIHMPTRDSTAMKAVLIAEATSAGTSALVYGRKTLDAYKYTTNVFTVSNELIQDSIVSAESEIIEVSGEMFGRGFNEAFTLADGSSKPLGLVSGLAALGSNAGIGKTGASTTAITYADLVDVKHSVNKAYRAGAKWMFNDLTEAAIRKLVDSTGQPIWTMGNIQNASPDTILGHAYIINDDMANLAAGAVPIAFGDFQKAYTIRMVRGVGLRRLTELYATSDEVGFVSFMRADGELMDTKAAKLFKNAAS